MPVNRPILHAIGNAHIDPVWLWRWTEGLETIRATFRSALDRMEEFPDFIFTGSSAAFYAMLSQADPDMLAEIRRRIQEGRWEIAGGWWIQPDANIPCGESLVRQALYGQRFFERELGVRASVGYNPDTFGHAGSLPQILKQAGLDSYVFMRPGPHEKELPGNLFLWQSPDGSQVLTCRLSRAYCTWSDDLSEHVLANHAARPDYIADYTVFYGVGDHGGGPTVRNIESLHEIAGKEGMPFVRLSSLKEYFAAVRKEMEQGAAVPVVAGELQHHARGCYTAHSEVKRQNRRIEHLLMTAERFASVAWLAAARPYPQESMAEAWQSLLFNQFHDIMAGTSLPEGYEDARDLFGHAATMGGRTLHYSLQSLTGQIDTRGEGSALVVFNPLPWPVTAPVEVERGSASVCDAEGHPVPAQSVQPTTTAGQSRSCFTARLPALGYRLFRQGVAKPVPETEGSLSAASHALENNFWRLEVDPNTGHLTRLYDRRNRVEVLAAPGNACIVIDDPSDTWSHGVPSFRSELGRFGKAEIAVEEGGPVRAALRIETRWGRSQVVQRLYLYRHLDIIECRLTVNWQEERKMLKLGFPLRLEEPQATYDIAYGHIQRPANGEEEPGQQWIDLSGYARTDDGERILYGVGLLNDSKYGFDILDAEMRMSLLRSPAYAHHDPSALDPNRRYAFLDQGIQTIAYRLVPHRGSWQKTALPRRAWELNVLPLWVNEYNHSGNLPAESSFLNAEPDNILLSVLKKAEEGESIIIRGYESAGKRTQATVSLPHLNISWQTVFKPHEIKSWRVSPENGSAVEEVDLLEEKRVI